MLREHKETFGGFKKHKQGFGGIIFNKL